MSNSEKYIPKVGDNFQYKLNSGTWSDCADCECLAIGKSNIFILNKHTGNEYLIPIIGGYEFRPIPTKADVERDRLSKLIHDFKTHMGGDEKLLLDQIQNAGFTIQKKVKRSEIRARLCESLESLHFISVETATDEMVNFLGDLVEDEA